ncbi:MAG: histidine--tRNA ligase [Planctomycetota bacterium]|jgi:histidyl-tRNA synthetase
MSSTATPTHKFQAPKGTRDFFPDDMAVRRYVESVWRAVSVNHGFDEIDGPTFEHLELYTVKSGPGIVSELFSFRRSGGDTDYALRPEFTPTLARMVAARAAQLPRPIKWFCMPSMFRAERPQRGRLREHIQWNVDIVGDASVRADAELMAVGVGVLQRLGFDPRQIQFKLSHRGLVSDLLAAEGLDQEQLGAAFALLDRRDKMPAEQFIESARGMGLSDRGIDLFAPGARTIALHELRARAADGDAHLKQIDASLGPLIEHLEQLDVIDWFQFDQGIVRGLAYYTGMVFEIHEASGKERAIAGGGRYDNLVELFGGTPIPAVGFAMGDVVIRLVLEDHGLLQAADAYLPRPDAFIISAGSEEAERRLPTLVHELRRGGLHVRHSYRTTRNVGKLLGEAGRSRARRAVILGRELEQGLVTVKRLDTGEQQEVPLETLSTVLASE